MIDKKKGVSTKTKASVLDQLVEEQLERHFTVRQLLNIEETIRTKNKRIIRKLKKIGVSDEKMKELFSSSIQKIFRIAHNKTK